MKYEVEVGVRITTSVGVGKPVLAQTMVEVEADSPAEAVPKAWSDAGNNISTFLGIDPKRQFDILTGLVFDRFRDVIGISRKGK